MQPTVYWNVDRIKSVKENQLTSDSITKVGAEKSPKENIFLYEMSPLVNVLQQKLTIKLKNKLEILN